MRYNVHSALTFHQNTTYTFVETLMRSHAKMFLVALCTTLALSFAVVKHSTGKIESANSLCNCSKKVV